MLSEGGGPSLRKGWSLRVQWKAKAMKSEMLADSRILPLPSERISLGVKGGPLQNPYPTYQHWISPGFLSRQFLGAPNPSAARLLLWALLLRRNLPDFTRTPFPGPLKLLPVGCGSKTTYQNGALV